MLKQTFMNNFKNFSNNPVSHTCENGKKNSISNMDIMRFSKGTVFDKKSSTTSIFFILDGLVEVTCGLIPELIVEKNFFFVIPPEAKYSIRFLERGIMVRCQPGEELLVEYISKISYKLYRTKGCQYKRKNVFFLEIEKRINSLLIDFVEMKSKRFSSERYACCKCEELLILMVKYYPAEELTWLFHLVFENKNVFRSIVLLNQNNLFSVDEFAAAAHLSRESFRQHFKKIFGETPAKWIQKRRADFVYKELSETDKSIQNIIRDHGFSNFPNFVRFCRMYLKKTPTAIRNEKNELEKKQIQLSEMQNDIKILPK
jgi:AraC-like DNA-binding protein/mannose-6-phosphate isomerase-like protein (cupin superfamily)